MLDVSTFQSDLANVIADAPHTLIIGAVTGTCTFSGERKRDIFDDITGRIIDTVGTINFSSSVFTAEPDTGDLIAVDGAQYRIMSIEQDTLNGHYHATIGHV